MLIVPRTLFLAAALLVALAAPALAEDDDAPATCEVLLCGGDAAEERQCTVIDDPGACIIILDGADESFEADPIPAEPLA